MAARRQRCRAQVKRSVSCDSEVRVKESNVLFSDLSLAAGAGATASEQPRKCSDLLGSNAGCYRQDLCRQAASHVSVTPPSLGLGPNRDCHKTYSNTASEGLPTCTHTSTSHEYIIIVVSSPISLCF